MDVTKAITLVRSLVALAIEKELSITITLEEGWLRDIVEADLREANLRGANLVGADISMVNLGGADPSGAN